MKDSRNLESCRFSLGYMVQREDCLLVAGSKRGILRLLKKRYSKHEGISSMVEYGALNTKTADRYRYPPPFIRS